MVHPEVSQNYIGKMFKTKFRIKKRPTVKINIKKYI